MRRLLLLLPLFALAGCKDPQDGVRVTVKSTDFVPKCIRVTAEDDASKETLSTSVAGKAEVLVGVVLPEKWSRLITITAEGFEQPPGSDGKCEQGLITPSSAQSQKIEVTRGAAKDSKPQEISLAISVTDADKDGYVGIESGGSDCKDGIPAINPGVKELCNDVDDNCDGITNESFSVGDECTSPEGCTSTLSCDPTDSSKPAICKAKELQFAWVDEDRDGFGDAKQGQVAVCSLSLPSTRLPLTSPKTDCNDGNGAIHPGVADPCDYVDNDCDGTEDNAYRATLGTQCAEPISHCSNGVIKCNSAGNNTECRPPDDAGVWYPDEDEDLHGRTDAGVISCPKPDAGYILAAGDCDDGNPYIHVDARELCDEQDNNCDKDRNIDENQVCGTTDAGWEPKLAGTDASRTWYGISLYGDGGVWLAGSNSGRGVKKPGATDFTTISGLCAGTTPTLFGVWANPKTRKAFMGGAEQHLLIQEDDSSVCMPQPSVNSGDNNTVITDMFGFVNSADPEDVQIFGVGIHGNGKDGSTFLWSGADATVTAPRATDTTLQGIHGLSPGLMFAVGSFKDPAQPAAKARILRYDAANSIWGPALEIDGTKGLNSVWVVNSKLAYAVGDGGTFLKWDGTTWAKATGPDGGERLTGVIAFGSNSIYVSSEAGKIHRYYDGIWHSTPALGASLYGINGTSPSDIWSVGVQGKVFHYPAWPQ